jgi:hypothetical protein
VRLINSELGNYAVLTEPATSLRAPEREAIRIRRRRFDTILREWVADAMQDGEIPNNDPGLVVAFFMGAVNRIPLWFSPEGAISGEEVARIFSNLIAYGMQGAAQLPPAKNR